MSSWRGAASRGAPAGASGEGKFPKRSGGQSAFGGSKSGRGGPRDGAAPESKSAFGSSPRPSGGSKFGGKGTSERSAWAERGSRPAGRQEAPSAFQTRTVGPSAAKPVGGRQFETSSAFGGSKRSADDAPKSAFGGSKRQETDASRSAFGSSRRPPAGDSPAFSSRRADAPQASSAFGKRPPATAGSSAFGTARAAGKPADAGGLFSSKRPAQDGGSSAFGRQRPSRGAPDAGGIFGSSRPSQDRGGSTAFGSSRPSQDQASSVFGSSKPRQGGASGGTFGSSRFGSSRGGSNAGVPEEVVEEVQQVAVPKALQNAQKQAGASSADVSVQKGPTADRKLLEEAAQLSPSVAMSTLKASVDGMLRDLATTMDVDGAVRQIVDAARGSGMAEFRSELVRMSARFAADADNAAVRVRAAQLFRVLLEGASAQEREAARKAERRAKKGRKGAKGGATGERALSKEQMEPLVNLVQVCTGIESVDAQIGEGAGAGAASGAGEEDAASRRMHLAQTLAILVQDGVLDRRGVPSEGTRDLLKLAGVRGVVDPAVAAASGIDSASAEQIAKETVDDSARGKDALAALQTRLTKYEEAGFVFPEADIAGALMQAAAHHALANGELTVKAPWLGESAFGALFEELLWEKTGSASAGLHALQGVLHEADFPPHVLEGTMLKLYREEIVEDKDFLLWASDTTNETAGKSRALSQLPRFLQRVKEDMEEDEEEDSDDDEGADSGESDAEEDDDEEQIESA